MHVNYSQPDKCSERLYSRPEPSVIPSSSEAATKQVGVTAVRWGSGGVHLQCVVTEEKEQDQLKCESEQ